MKLEAYTKRQRSWYLILYGVGLYLLLGGFLFNTPAEIFESMKAYLVSPGGLLTDYMEVGTIGGALFNAGFMTIFYTAIFQYLGVVTIGPSVASIFNLTAFSLLGKNIFNTIWLFLGGMLHGHIYDVEPKGMAPTAIFATGIAPLMSYVTFVMPVPRVFGFILGLILSMLAGFILPMVSPETMKFHKRHSLYNNGMALGFIAIILVSALRAYGFDPEPQFVNMEGVNYKIVAYFLTGYLLLMLPRIIKHKGMAQYFDLIKTPGLTGTDYTSMYDTETVMFNMGLVGAAGVLFVLIVGGDINGLTMGAAFAVCAFAMAGKHIKNVIPIMIGVALCALVTDHDITATGVVMAGLFGTTIAPIAGSYGPLAGIIAGFTHLILVTQFGRMHGNLLLYNNGLTGGVVAGTLVAIFNKMGMETNTYGLDNPDN